MAFLAAAVLSAAGGLAVPDVPFVAQPESLCGGAALAMVLRYWGDREAAPEDFAAALLPDGRGISPEALAAAAEGRGYRTFRSRGDPDSVRPHLERGWPVIALRSSGPGRHHYVVLLAWREGSVLFHDPSEGPFRTLPEVLWRRASAEAAGWTVLVLPAPGAPPSAPDARRGIGDTLARETGRGTPSSCSDALAKAVQTAREGDLPAAEALLARGPGECEAIFLRERAGIAFRRESWTEAVELADRALALDPEDHLARRLQATSLYLADRRDEALASWNQLGEPRLTQLHVDGLTSARFRDVGLLLDLPEGRLLRQPDLERARRRLQELPAAQAARLTYRPLAGGTAEASVHVLERSTAPRLSRVLLDSGLQAVEDGALAGRGHFLTGRGELLEAGFSWREARSDGSLSVSAPGALRLPGLVRASVSFDEQTYAPSHGLVRERRKGAALELSNWWTADVRLGVRAAYDTWSASGGHLSLGLDLDRRTWADRVSLRGTAALFVPLEGGAAFVSSSLRLAARTSAAPARLAFRGELSYDSTAVRAPRGLWPGAGTGQGRGRLLRAHPLLDGGVVSGPAFGPGLVRAGIEAEAGLLTLAAFRVSLAVFADAAALPHGARGSRSFLDLGAGLRLALPGTSTSLRADLALPASGGPPVFSFGVVRAWPN